MEFLIEYGLFLAKSVTVLVSVLVVIVVIFGSTQRQKDPDVGHIEVKNLNDSLEGITHSLKSIVLNPELLKKDLNESLKEIRSPSDYLKDNIDAFHTELVFYIATSVILGKKEESLDYIKNNLSKETFDWVNENMNMILKALGS